MDRKKDNYDFVDIEDYYSAYKDILADYLNIFKNLKQDSQKVLLMHLGGIIIECYIKYIIVRVHDIKKSRRNTLWYSEKVFNNISNQKNLEKKYINEQATKNNPGHNIRRGIEEIDTSLKDVIEQDKNINKAIEIIQNPLLSLYKNKNGYDEIEYIDLRYISSDEITNIDILFDEWKGYFSDLNKWLLVRSGELGV